jgi:ribonuclease P protein component
MPKRGPNALPKSRILRNPAVFRVHFARGVRESAGPLVALAVAGEGKLGITVPRKVGPAVARNRVRRRIREAFRLRLSGPIPANADVVLLVKPHALLTVLQYGQHLGKLFGKLAARPALPPRA